MKLIPLRGKVGEGKFALVDDKDYEWLSQYKWYLAQRGYACRGVTINGKTKLVSMHRMILGCKKGQMVDHINHNKLDNQRSNLRIVTHSQNQMNRVKSVHKSSKYKGVYYFGEYDLWRSRIKKNKVRKDIGLFKNERHAALAYDLWAVHVHGKYVYTNFQVIGYG